MLSFQAPIVVPTSSEDALDSKYVDVLNIELPARNIVFEKMESKKRFELHDQTKTPGTPGQAGPMFSVRSNEPSGAFLTSRERERRCETSAFKKFAIPHEKQGAPKYSGA
jgi:pyruvate/2-oxoacid:ferredoxin oxidoreductase alpha subunit